MSHTLRRIIFWTFVLIFCVATLVLSLQAAGYKLSFTRPFSLDRILQKTGMLIVESNPEGAMISIDEKPLTRFSLTSLKKAETATPAKIGNLLPGRYSLSLELEGYWPIQKTVEIRPGQTTLIDDVNLFRNELPWLLLSSGDGAFSLSPDNSRILAETDNGWKVVETASQAVIELGGNVSSSRFAWIDGGTKLLLGSRLYDFRKDLSDTNFSSIIGGASALCYQSQQQKLYYAYGDNLNCLNTSDLSTQVIASGDDIQDIIATSDYLIIITNEDQKSKLKILDYAGKIQKSIDLPFSSYSLAIDKAGWIDLYDRQKQSLYIIDPKATGQPLLKTFDKTSTWQWIGGSQILYATDFEIHLADIKSGQDDTLLRIAEKISGAFKQEDSRFIIYAAGDYLRALEMTGQNVSVELFRGENLKLFGFDQKESIAYFFAKIGQQQGVYQIKMK